MNKIFIPIIFAITFIIAGCGDSACYKQLIEVDSLTENDFNDSAYNTIKEIEKTYRIKDGKERAYYSLLKYQLQFRKNYENKNFHVNDSLIDYSISYYSDNEDVQKLALSYYLKGRMSNAKDAIRYLKKAEFAALKTDDNFLKMRIYNNIALANANNEDYKTALKFGLKAIEYGQKTNDIETLIGCYLNVSNLYLSFHQPDSSVIYINKCLDYLDQSSPIQKLVIYLNIAAASENTDTAKARKYALEALKIEKTHGAYQILAKLERDRNNYAMSEVYLTEALKLNPRVDYEAFILYELAQTKELMGKHEEANEISQKVIMLRDSVEHIKARDSIREMQLAAELDNTKQNEIKEKDNNTIAIATALTLTTVLTAAAYTRRRRKHKKSMNDIETMEKDIKAMEKDMNNAEKQMDLYRHEIRKMEEENKEKDNEIMAANKNMMKQLERQKKEAEKARMDDSERYHEGFRIYNEVKEAAHAINRDKESMKSLIMYYTSICPEFKNETEKKYTRLTEQQYALLIMKDMQLTNKQIATLLGISEGAVRTQTSRISKAGEEA